MPLVSTIVRCCVHIVRLVCGRTEGRKNKPSTVTLRRMRRGLITCENYDDVVAVKPGKLLTDGCTQNVTVDNAKVILGVGMSIGSVPPNTDINCIRDVWFRNVEFINPLNAIYVKTNSGKDGFGIIDNINYQNITIHAPVPILWLIYIGPQQQKEPDGGGDGIWPPPQPLVNVTNILLQNVTSDNGWLNAGVLRCAQSI